MALEKEKPKQAKKTRTVDKWKKKQWFELIAPKEFDEKQLGETVAEKEKTLVNRVVKVNLGDLTGQRQRRHITVSFKVASLEGKRAKTFVVGHEMGHGFLNRLVRRRMSKLEVTQVVETEDGKKLKVKSIVLSVRKLARKQQTALRNTLRDSMQKSCKKKPLVQLQQELIFGVAASKVFKQLKKIAPLRRVEVTESRLVEGK